jgi:hypothetical protein
MFSGASRGGITDLTGPSRSAPPTSRPGGPPGAATVFLIAIGAGALTLGATALDPAADVRHQNTAQVQTTGYQATSSYATYEDCVRAMAQHYLPASNCQQR